MVPSLQAGRIETAGVAVKDRIVTSAGSTQSADGTTDGHTNSVSFDTYEYVSYTRPLEKWKF